MEKKTEKKEEPRKSMLYALITYATPEQIAGAVKDKVDDCIIAYHDKDTKDDGTPKEPHYHVLICTKVSREPKEVKGWFDRIIDEDGKQVNTLLQYAKSTEDALQYLTHSNSPEKYQYGEEVIKVLYGSKEHWLSKKGVLDKQRGKEERDAIQEEKNEELLQDLLEKKPMREMAKKYGRDYMKNWKIYNEFAFMVKMQETGEIDISYIQDPKTQIIEADKRQYASQCADNAVNRTLEVIRNMVSESEKTKEYAEMIERKRK